LVCAYFGTHRLEGKKEKEQKNKIFFIIAKRFSTPKKTEDRTSMDSQDIIAFILVAAVVIFFTYCARAGRREKNKDTDFKEKNEHVKS
jgi:hypothetical protein